MKALLSNDLTRTLALGCVLVLTGCLTSDDTSTNEQEIVGGTSVSISDYPWQISLQTNDAFHFCGGSILSESWILTAQHCVDGGYADMRVVAGMSRLSQPGQGRAVDGVFTFPGYDGDPANGHDVALLHLSSPLNLGNSASPIAMVDASAAAAGVADPGVVAWVSGWGTLSSGGSSPDNLQAVDVPIVSNADADAAYRRESITDDQIGAGYIGQGGKDSCQGDSGGPLVVPNGNGSLLAGVVSWGYGCADPRYPGMYARVSSFEPWIATRTGASTTASLDQSISDSTDSWSHFTVDVPAGAHSLSVLIAGGSGDADLYVRYGSQPSTNQYDCRPYLNGSYEFCTFDTPSAGTWHVSVHAYASYSGVSLTALTLTDGGAPPPPPAEVCDDGVDNDGDGDTDCADSDCSSDPSCQGGGGGGSTTFTDSGSVPQGGWDHYAPFSVSPGSSFDVTMTQRSRDTDLYVRFGSQPTTTQFDCSPQSSGGDEQCHLTVPAGVTEAYVSLRGVSRRRSRYDLSVTYTP